MTYCSFFSHQRDGLVHSTPLCSNVPLTPCTHIRQLILQEKRVTKYTTENCKQYWARIGLLNEKILKSGSTGTISIVPEVQNLCASIQDYAAVFYPVEAVICRLSVISLTINFHWFSMILVTFGRHLPFACMVTRAAQHTRALELERPELPGTVPSTIHFIPRAADWILRCSTNPRNPHWK